ncbi:DUF2784 domain-containing protein [Mycobacterium asiaticum]|uniref:DUF2784 domain-containing protein n=1 Tax=Mycobacterium asiaticum TaxID=1790 RepID=A0A1A3CBD2_MYCAS|nr:DUF2784 domain-containing protein [Mycobacterium asiaticum]OBI83993.1 hypothetical protein A9X01_20005 [Mycobacterium asiaticum]
MRKAYSTVVVATAAAHLAYLIYLPSGGFLALRGRRTLWLHVPAVCWGMAVVGLRLQCPLTSLEAWARQRAELAPLPETGFIGRYVEGVLLPGDRIGTAQKLAFAAAAASWVALAVQRRKAGYPIR